MVLIMTKDYIGKRVKIKHAPPAYRNYDIAGKIGVVERVSGGSLGVLLDDLRNRSSEYGNFWLAVGYLEFLDNESEDVCMEGYKYVACVNLLEDTTKKDYWFALYEGDRLATGEINEMAEEVIVVVNPRRKNNRVLGVVKHVVPIDSYTGLKPTSEVVGVVDTRNYIAREAEKTRLAELEKKKKAIEEELEKEINKRKSIEYYAEMAKQYSDNPRLAELVLELRALGE